VTIQNEAEDINAFYTNFYTTNPSFRLIHPLPVLAFDYPVVEIRDRLRYYTEYSDNFLPAFRDKQSKNLALLEP
jgi:hypothetical protein